MEINGLQLISLAFSIFMAYFAYVEYRRKQFSLAGLCFWICIFAGVMAAALFPNTFLPFTRLLNIARVFDLFTIVGFFFLITVTFINFLHINRLNIKISKMVQSKALEDEEKKKS
ncbi:MAG: DUF2304 domain-containing protein [Candidatus Peregrinibacteria bacterium]|nr:DUF2304 domain-containing protein [Candidatus Peregrinibacteria bacterium]